MDNKSSEINDKEEDNISLSSDEYKSDNINNKKYDMEIEDISNKTISDMENEKKENLIITEEYKSEHLLIKEIIEKILTEDDKLKQILTLVEKIRFPFYNLNYNCIDYYKGKYIYLLSAVICNKKRIYPDFIK